MFWQKIKRTEEKGKEKDAPANAPKLPESFKVFLPEADHLAPWESLEDGNVVVAGLHGLSVVGEQGVVDSGLWHEIQYSAWDPEDRVFTLVWIQPERPGLRVATVSENPRRFMERVTNRVTDTVVVTRSFFTPAGTRVSASVRRRVDGALFLTLLADGPLTADDQVKAEQVADDLGAEFKVED